MRLGPTSILSLLLLVALSPPPQACAQLNSTYPVWQQQIFPVPLSARTGSVGFIVNASSVVYFGGVPAASAITNVCLAPSGTPPPALSTTLSVNTFAAQGSSVALSQAEAPLSTPLSTALAAVAPLPPSKAGRLVSFGGEGSTEVLLWEGGATTPVVCTAPPAPRPLPRAAAGLVYLTSCTLSLATPPAPCFVLVGGTLAGGEVANDLWFLYGADAPTTPTAPAPNCSWVSVPQASLAGDPLPGLTNFALVSDAAYQEGVLYGGQTDGGGASGSVLRFAPLGFLDANPDTEMVNVALPNNGLVPFASQSSIPPTSLGWQGFPGRAIDNLRWADGNLRTTYFDGFSCTHTAPNDPNPWWGIDLQAPTAIHALRLYQRTDCCIGRFAGLAVYFSNTNATNSTPTALPWAADGVRFPLPSANLLSTAVLFRTPENTTARFVWLSLPGSGRYLTICEMQVLQRLPLAVRDLGLPKNVALGKPTFGPFTAFGTGGGGQLLANVVDGVRTGATTIQNGQSYAQVLGPTGAGASSLTAQTPYIGIDLGGVFTLSGITIFPSSGAGLNPAFNPTVGNTRLSVYAGNTRDFNFMARCFGPAAVTAGGLTGGTLGAGGFLTLPGCTSISARYVAVARGLIDSPPLGDANQLAMNEIQVWAASQGLTSPRYNVASARWGGYLWVFGGSDAGGAFLGDLRLLDLNSWQWVPPPVAILGSFPLARSGAAMVYLPHPKNTPSLGLALFGGSGSSGDFGDVTLLTFPTCPPLSLWGARGMTCDETGTVCQVTCLPTWTVANPGTNNVFTCGIDGTWGIAALPPCTGVIANTPNNIGGVVPSGFDASGRGQYNVTWRAPTDLAYVPEGFRGGYDNAGGDFTAPCPFFPNPGPNCIPAYPGFGKSAADYVGCWEKCNQTVGCIAYAFQNVAPYNCWLKASVKPWGVNAQRISGDLPNPLRAYRVTAVPNGLTDFFASTVYPLGGTNFTAGSTTPNTENANSMYQVSGISRCGGSLTVLPTGALGMDQTAGVSWGPATSCTCSVFPTLSAECLLVNRPWPETIAPSTGNWVVETYVSTPGGQTNSLRNGQSVGLALFNSLNGPPILFGGISGSTPSQRTLDFFPYPYMAGPPPETVKRSVPWTALGAFLRLEYSASTQRIRLGFRALTSQVWSYHPWLNIAFMSGGSPLGIPSLRVGFVLSNGLPNGVDTRAYAEVSYLRVTVLNPNDLSRGCPSIGPALTTTRINIDAATLFASGIRFPGLQGGVTYRIAVQAITPAGLGRAGYTGVINVPSLPSSYAATSVESQLALAGKLTSFSSSAATGGTTLGQAYDGNLATAFLSSTQGVFADFPGERFTLNLGQAVSIYNLSVAGNSLANWQVLVHTTPTDWVSGYDTQIWGALGGAGAAPSAILRLSPPVMGQFVTVRNGFTSASPAIGQLSLAELRVWSGNACPAFIVAGANTVVVSGGAVCSSGGAGLGSNCTLACAPGTSQIGGSTTGTCTGDAWSAPALVCAPLCPPLPIPSDLASCVSGVFSDTFSYTSPTDFGVSLAAPPSNAVAPWTALDRAGASSGWGGAWTLSSGALQANSLPCGGGHVMVNPSSTLASLAAGTFSILADVSTTSSAGLVWGALDILNYYRAYMQLQSPTGKNLVIERVVGGVVTTLSKMSAPSLNPRFTYTLNLTVVASTSITLSLNNRLLTLVSNDASPTLASEVATSGSFGMYAEQDGTFDNFLVTTSCFSGGVTVQTRPTPPGATFSLTCSPGFAPSFTPFVYTCGTNSSGGPALLPAIPPSCSLAPPIFPPQFLSIQEGSGRGTPLLPNPLKGSLLSPSYTLQWALNSQSTFPSTLCTAFAVSSCTGEVRLLQDGQLGPANRPHANVSVSVTASVAGYPESFVIRTIPVTVVVVDQPPTMYPTLLPLNENSLGGTVVGAPTWFDWDVNWTVPVWYTYTWTWSDASGGLLVLDPITGAITVAPGVVQGALNYEALLPSRTYSQVTRMTQVNNTLFTSSAVVSVVLNDLNDPPTIPGGQILGPLADTSAVPGASVGVVQAVDEDIGIWAGASTFALVPPAVAVSMWNTVNASGESMGYFPGQLSGMAACAAIALLPTLDGTLTGAFLFSVTPVGGNVTVVGPPPTACSPGACVPSPSSGTGWSGFAPFQGPNQVLMRARFQVCVNATDTFGAWGVGVADVYVSVNAQALANIPLITSWSCTGPGITQPTTIPYLPTEGGTPGQDLCTITGTSFSTTSVDVSLRPQAGTPAAGLYPPINATAGCTLVSATTITCTPPPGAGSGLNWYILNNPGFAQQQAFDQSGVPVYYAPPTVTGLALDSGTISSLPVAGGAILTLTGSNFGPPGTAITFTYGPPASPYVCAPLGLNTQTSFSCTIPPGNGGGLSWTFTVAGTPVLSDASQFLSYTPASITGLRVVNNRTGVVYDAPLPLGPATVVNVSTDGSDSVYLVGNNMGSSPGWLVSGTGSGIPSPLGVFSCLAAPEFCPCPPPSTTCFSLPAPPGAGPTLGLSVFSGNQLASPSPLQWAFNPPVVTSVALATPPILAATQFPTTGGALLSIKGFNFGPVSTTTAPGFVLSVAFGVPGTPIATWAVCSGLTPLGDFSLTCLLPEGGGASLSVAVNIGGVIGVTPGVLNYDPPSITSAVLVSGGTVTQVQYPTGVNTTTPIDVLRGPTLGGTVVSLTGTNFGLNLLTAASVTNTTNLGSFPLLGGGVGTQFPNCIFLTWAQRPAGTPTNPRTHTCDGGESWLGEGEVPSANILVWTHTRIDFIVPPGIGQKEVQLVVTGAPLTPPRVGNTSVTFTALSSPPTVTRFWYADPIITSLRACTSISCNSPLPPPALVGTDGCGAGFKSSGCTLLRLDGSNFGPSPLGIVPADGNPLAFPPPGVLSQLVSDVYNPPVPSSLAASLMTAYMVVTFHRSCVAFGANSLGGPAPSFITVGIPSLGVAPVPVAPGGCLQQIVSQTDSTILFLSAPGVGVNREVGVVVASDATPAGQLASAPPPLLFSYAPPVVTGFSPSIVPLGQDVTAPALINIYGQNFGNDELAAQQAWTAAERSVSGSLYLNGTLLPFEGNCTRSRSTDTSGTLVTVLNCGVDASKATAGFAGVVITVAGQTASTVGTPAQKKLLFACLQGYYARMGEVCNACPAYNPNPSLVGAECSTPHPGKAASPDPLNFLTPPPECCSSTCGTFLDPASGRTLPTPICGINNLTDAQFPLRFLYPRPLAGWYNLNSSDLVTTGMRSACPPDVAAQTAPRDVCIVPCNPSFACLGDNKCAFGYVSNPPAFRCSSCALGFFASAGRCAKCPDSPAAVFVVFALIVVSVAGLGYWLNKQQVNIAMLSIGVDFFQVLAIFATSGIAWPPAILTLLSIMSAFNLNIEIVSPECLVPKVTWGQKFLAIMALPIVVGSMLLGVYLAQACVKRSRGHTDKRKLWSHTPALVSSTLVLLYLLYLYLTRTALDVFNCAPTNPDDGRTYLQVVFQDCADPGGIRQTMWPLAAAGLLFYTFGYPAYVGYKIYSNRELAMQDQLLRAKGVGNDKLSNPNALTLRQTWGRTYYQFKPEYGLWVLAVIFRKACIAFSAIMFNRSVNFQMAACLLIMFLAYAAQVQTRPYLSPGEFGAVLEAYEAAALKGDPLAVRLKVAIAGIDSKGRKKGVARKLFRADNTLDASALVVAARDYVFNFNTVEATMLFCVVIVCLMALMYNANNGSNYYPQAADSITSVTLLTIVFGIVYFVSALGVEVASIDACKRRARGGTLAGGKKGVLHSQMPLATGPIDVNVNPMFLNNEGTVTTMGSKESLVTSILSMKDAPPPELWGVFKQEFASAMESLKTTQEALAGLKQREQQSLLGGAMGGGGGPVGGGSLGGGGMLNNPLRTGRSTRTELAPVVRTPQRAAAAAAAAAAAVGGELELTEKEGRSV